MSTLARRDVRLAVIAALNTIVGLKVVSPGTWDSQPAGFPEAKVRVPGDRKVSTGRHPVTFTTTVSVQIQIHVEALTDTAAQNVLEALCGQVEIAVLGNVALVSQSQHFPMVSTQTDIDTAGKKAVGSAVITLDVEVFEDFDPVFLATAPAVPVSTVQTTVRTGSGVDDVTLVSNVGI